jgi:heptosyltransferase-3
MRRILVLRGGALGDFIVTLPALAVLRRQWPGAEIHLVGNPAAAALARNRGLLSNVHSQHEARWSGLYAAAPLPVDFAAWLAKFDLVLNYWPDPSGELQRRFPLRPGQRFLSAAALPGRAPASAHYCAPLAALGLGTDWAIFALEPRDANPAGPILLHPGSGSTHKNWPRERWLTLLEGLRHPVTLILGEAEASQWQAADLPHLPRLANETLETLVHHLRRCRLFLGHDSGISHLAAACGAPSILLFGPTDPAVWAPPAPHVRVLRHGPDLASIPVDEVRRALATALAGPA